MTARLTPDLGELRRLAEAATPGPWTQDACYVVGQVPGGRPGGEVIVRAGMTVDGHRWNTRQHREADAAYIAAADPTTIKALLDRVDALERVREAARSFFTFYEIDGDGEDAIGIPEQALWDELAVVDAAEAGGAK